MAKYKLTEKESTDSKYVYEEYFDTREDAQKIMKTRYHELAIDNCENVNRAELNDNSALVSLVDGYDVEWSIEQIKK